MIKNNIQDFILNQVRKDKLMITVYLSNGVPIKGRVISFDNFTIVIELDNRQSMIYKHAITTITPEKSIRLHNPDEEKSE
ncbi:MAG: RNA chaperone Hfq [Leptospiraceae bacterium]|nr:RNA chaperone Hfq [Leptospiraceae bacterium]MCB1199495.1 RNA chaperone Hfq [Leptospiraceae bacterium]